VAHLDISLENLCLDEHNRLHLIDFALAVLHPSSPETGVDLTKQHSSSTFTRLAKSNDGKRMFLCPGIRCDQPRPGKVNYMAPEIWSFVAWDAYAADCWSLGIVLFMLTVGRHAYEKPSRSDRHFAHLVDHKWSRQLAQPGFDKSTVYYGHLSPLIVDLLDQLFVSQTERLTCEQILAHPWFDVSD
jgi:serine/threonine protein kinase